MTVGFLKQKFQAAPPAALKAVVAEVWRHYGYRVRESPESNATGVDLLATRSHPYSRTEVLCIEHRSSDNDPVENSRVQQVSALRRQEDADDVIIVTSGTVTDAAVSLAGELEVHVVDGENLIDTIHSAGLYPTVAEHVPVDASVTQGIHLETMAERVVRNTDIGSMHAVYDVLYTFFAEHATGPRIDKTATLSAFSGGAVEHEWEHSTTVGWSANPELNSEDIAAYLADELSDTETPSIELPVVAAAIDLELDEALGKQPSEMSADELATWCVEAFDESEVPMAVREPGRAVDVAEGVIDTNDSVAVNKLRVAEELNRR